MIDFNNVSLLNSWTLDVILILISASACFYCALLSRRLKALNNLDTGVGASIVSLTEAIGKTHDAARAAQSSTKETVQTLRFLLEKSESMAPKVEAAIAEMERSLSSVEKLKTELKTKITPELDEAGQRARVLANNLLKTVKVLETRYDVMPTHHAVTQTQGHVTLLNGRSAASAQETKTETNVSAPAGEPAVFNLKVVTS